MKRKYKAFIKNTFMNWLKSNFISFFSISAKDKYIFIGTYFKYIAGLLLICGILNLLIPSLSNVLVIGIVSIFSIVFLISSFVLLSDINNLLRYLRSVISKTPLARPIILLITSLLVYLSHKGAEEYVVNIFGVVSLDYFNDFVTFLTVVGFIFRVLIILISIGVVVFSSTIIIAYLDMIFDMSIKPLVEPLFNIFGFDINKEKKQFNKQLWGGAISGAGLIFITLVLGLSLNAYKEEIIKNILIHSNFEKRNICKNLLKEKISLPKNGKVLVLRGVKERSLFRKEVCEMRDRN